MTCWPLSRLGFLQIYRIKRAQQRKYRHIFSAVGLFYCDKFEETPNEKVVNMSKFTKSYFSTYLCNNFWQIIFLDLETLAYFNNTDWGSNFHHHQFHVKFNKGGSIWFLLLLFFDKKNCKIWKQFIASFISFFNREQISISLK